ncbi:transcriptional regulator [Listeria monocytogenes]|uniref:transcriptional regulator n=1 Tax=Listeria monocytogenes TaxID=1639 RepID=UPI002150816B|nr:transcriptional regulator [Listeria monocytogenes]MCR6344888.1 transcriptional regulator [Listeria monocytogenes]MCR6406445.1 transcriptional regulator [Listeria monocytogenes]MCR6419407.1 transcriptional regulator [Listeria monocytogenes]
MAGFIKKYLDGKDWTIYQLGNATGLAHQTIRMADKKTVDQMSAKNVRLTAEVFGFTAGEMLDEFYEIEKEINNDEILKELTTVFEKYGYNTDEISSELLDGEKIKLDTFSLYTSKSLYPPASIKQSLYHDRFASLLS